MWKIKDVKKKAKYTFLHNFGECFIVCLIIVFITSGSISITETIETDKTVLTNVSKTVPGTPVAGFINNLIKETDNFKRATSIGDDSKSGVIASMYHSTMNTVGFTEAVTNLINKSVFSDRASQIVLGAISVFLMLLSSIFIGGLFKIGAYRFFLETRIYEKTPLMRLLYVYRSRRIFRSALVVFLKFLYLFLFLFTIIGFPIKYYSYTLVPLIQAENPNIPAREVLKLSERMMVGNKWHTFRLDLSFIGWWILSILTFGLLDYLWVNPYQYAAKAELYAQIREEAKAKAIPGTELLNDNLLFAQSPEPIPANCEESMYPAPLNPNIPYRANTGRNLHWTQVEAKAHYTILNLIILFFVFSFVGWIWECSLEFIKHGWLINRGTMYGPWIPIYGVGAMAILIIINRLNKRPFISFVSIMVFCGIIEYVGATILWHTKHLKYWDYSGFFLNIQGRVCLEGLLAFGILGMVGMYLIGPLADNMLERIPKRTRLGIAGVLVAAFSSDLTYCHFHPHTGPGITSGYK